MMARTVATFHHRSTAVVRALQRLSGFIVIYRGSSSINKMNDLPPFVLLVSVFFVSRTKARNSAAAARKREGGLLGHSLNHIPTKVTVDFGNSPLVHQHLRLLTRGEAPSVTPVRVKVSRREGLGEKTKKNLARSC